MNQGLYLSLRVGSMGADPAPQPVIDALSEVQVSSTVGAQSGFQLKFTLGKRSLIGQTLLPSGYFDPRRRVIITVVVNGSPTVLMDGIITKQDVTPSNTPGQSTLTVTGLDISALMDFIDLTGIPYPAMPLFAIIDLVLAKYLAFGVVPVVIPDVIGLVQNPLERLQKQQGTDYQYVTSLARRCGHVFYIDPGPQPGMSIAYWGPELGGFFPTQSALGVDLDVASNAESLNFSYDGTVAKQYIVTILEPNSKIPIPIPLPDIDFLKASLSKKAPTPLKSEVLGDMANKSFAEAAMIVIGALVRSADAVSASGQLDVLRYGHVLKARQKVGVRGAGPYYDGLYSVKSVTHNIKHGQYTQSFTLKRGGLFSSVDTVQL
ncbi:hypothetical protein SAMN05216570_3069 [Dyella sp. OK004]|uniref:hypothetical protein n=1 Tax=Dyella sp. OK004 TaxID=1855292 RepID=UPI0008E1E215|nr:hypothetical protein [Dyella sp. OK004]SFS14351.1 hypothetical protein SAMN05216570_3069 [Dyella sp. OK004]